MNAHWIGLAAAGLLGGLGYYFGIELHWVLLAIAVGTLLEYFILRK